MQLLWLYKVDLQCGQAHVCSHYTANGITCPPVQHIMWPKWLDINASCMCLDEFTPEFTAVCLWSGYQRRIFHAEVCAIDDVIAFVSLCRVLRCCAISTAIHGRVPQGGKWGIKAGSACRWGGGQGVMSARHSTASKNDSRWSDAQPNSSHYHESTGLEECCEKKGEWAKRAESEPDNSGWKIWCISISLTHTHTYTTKSTHTFSTTHEPI